MRNFTCNIILFLTVFSIGLKSQEVEWASEVLGFSSELYNKQYSAAQALGKPSVMPYFGDSKCAWTPKSQYNPNGDWIYVSFSKHIYVKQIIICENYNPGSLKKIIFFDSLGNENLVYNNPKVEKSTGKGRINNIFIQRTNYRVFSAKIFFKQSPQRDVFQVDAIGVSDSEIPFSPKINFVGDINFNFQAENLGENVNSSSKEVAPVISPDGKTLFFTRDSHPGNMGKAKKQDIWYSALDETNQFTNAKNIGPPINNEEPNYAISVTPDGNSLLVGNVYLPIYSQGISVSYFTGLEWTFPEKLKIRDYYNKNKSTGNSLGNDGKTLIMALERDDTYGGLDLYVSFLQRDSSWSEPRNIGPNINSADDDFAPFLASDGVTLYYATSCHCGYGQSDIFISRRLDTSWTKWSEPENMGPMLNTAGWDAYFTIPASGEFGYFVSNKSGFGNEDLFRIKLPNQLRPKPVVLISGKVINMKTKLPVSAKIKYEILPEGAEAGIARANPITGDYKIVLPGGNKYGFLAEAEGFIAINQNLDLKNINFYQELVRDLYLVPIEKGQTIKLNNIFFEFGKFDLLNDSFAELERLNKLLMDKPYIRIEIQGHTDNIGTMERNLDLSRKRAQSVANYLTSKGISTSRMVVRGYGPKKPVAPNDSEENRQKNRRVEFTILN